MKEENVRKKPDQQLLDFFNNATVHELMTMNGCSEKKAEVIVAVRPFDDWDDLVSQMTVILSNDLNVYIRLRTM